MKKLFDYARKAMFYVRVLSGYEERRIRSYRLQLHKRIQQAEEKKAAVRKVPEQIILSEVRLMVEEMKALNKKLEETESAIEEYFKPIDKEAETIMKIQLDGEEKRAREMVKRMQAQALLEQAEAERFEQLKAKAEAERFSIKAAESNQNIQEKAEAESIEQLKAAAETETILKIKTEESSQNTHEKAPPQAIAAGATSS